MLPLLEGGLEVLLVEVDDVALHLLPAGLRGWRRWGLLGAVGAHSISASVIAHCCAALLTGGRSN